MQIIFEYCNNTTYTPAIAMQMLQLEYWKRENHPIYQMVKHHLAGCIEESGEMTLAALGRAVKNNPHKYQFDSLHNAWQTMDSMRKIMKVWETLISKTKKARKKIIDRNNVEVTLLSGWVREFATDIASTNGNIFEDITTYNSLGEIPNILLSKVNFEKSIIATFHELQRHFTVDNYEYAYLHPLTRGFAGEEVDFPDDENVPFPPRPKALIVEGEENVPFSFFPSTHNARQNEVASDTSSDEKQLAC